MKELPRFLEKKEYSTKMVQVKFIPGEHCFLENIQIQLREIKVFFKKTFRGDFTHLLQGEEVMTIVFYAGPEL